MLQQIRIDQSEFDAISHSNKTSASPVPVSRQIIGFECTCKECDKEFFSRHDCPECYDCGSFDFEISPCYGFYKEVDVRVTSCLLCDQEISSAYLSSIFPDDKTYQLACMVMHYRHDHVKYYNNSVGYVTTYKNVEYDDFKTLVNERAKRQILRKAKDKLIAQGFTIDNFKSLKNSDEKTIALAEKILSNNKEITNEKDSH